MNAHSFFGKKIMEVGKLKLGLTRDAKRKVMRSKILNAGIEMFAEKGFHQTRMSEIAMKARVADGTIYRYFVNKDDLLISCFEEIITVKLDEVKASLEKIPNKGDKLISFIDAHIKVFTENPSIAKFMILELRQSPEFYKKYPNFWPIKRYLAYLKKLCEEAIEAGKIKPVNPSVLTIMLFGMMDYVLMEWALTDKIDSLDNIKNEIQKILENGIKK